MQWYTPFFNFSTGGEGVRQRQVDMSSRPGWFTGQLGLHRETTAQNANQPTKTLKKLFIINIEI